MRTVSTAAFPPKHGSIATGLGAPLKTTKEKTQINRILVLIKILFF